MLDSKTPLTVQAVHNPYGSVKQYKALKMAVPGEEGRRAVRTLDYRKAKKVFGS